MIPRNLRDGGGVRSHLGETVTPKISDDSATVNSPEQNKIHLGSSNLDMTRALRWAVIHGHTSEVRELLEKGSKDTSDHDGVTAMHLAAKGGHADILRLLLAAGAPLEARMHRIDGSTDRSNGTPLHWAAIEGQFGSIEALLEAGASVDARNEWDRTPLHLAARYGHDQSIRLLVSRGASLEARRDTNETPLHFAVEEACSSSIELLLELGADIDAWGDRGTPLQLALSLRHRDISILLISKNADLSQIRLQYLS